MTWIPVSESMPNKGHLVLGYSPTRGPLLTYTEEHPAGLFWHVDECGGCSSVPVSDGDVTDWQELPRTPERFQRTKT